jgi:hypothetical protein
MLLLLALLAQPGDSTPARRDSVDVVYYGGKRVIYRADENRVYLLDSAWVQYQDMRLRSDSIIYDIKQHQLNSFGRSYFRTATDSVAGDELHYNVDGRKGYMTVAATRLNEGFFSGRDLWLVREKTFDVNSGDYTTCDHAPPHYRFWGKRIRVYLDDMVVVEPLVLKLGRVPIAAAPFWFFPISKNRKSGLLPFKVGNSKTEGFYAKNVSWFWAINDYSDATFVLDAMSRKGFRWSGEGNYVVGNYASGSFLGSYINESDTRAQRYSLGARHSSQFLFGTRIDGRADFSSDAGYVSDYSETPMLWLKNEFDSYLNLSRTFKNVGSGSATVRRHDYVQMRQTLIELPSFSLSFVSLPLGRGWHLNSGVSAGNTTTTQDSLLLDSLTGRVIGYDTLGKVRRVVTARSVSPSLSLSLPPSLLGGLTLPLSGSYSETRTERQDTLGSTLLDAARQASGSTGLGFSQNLFGWLGLSENLSYSHALRFYSESTHATVGYGLGASGHFSLYRIFPLELAGMHGVLHRASPSLGLSYTPRTAPRGCFAVPRFDTLPSQGRLSFGLGNDFQTKLGDSVQTKRSLGSVNFSSGYDLLADSHKFSDVGISLDVDPVELPNTRLLLSGGTTFGVYDHRFKGYSLITTFSQQFANPDTSAAGSSRRFSLALSHSISGSRIDTTPNQNMLSLELRLAPRGWSFALKGGWNLTELDESNLGITDYTLDVVKDLHCWEAVGSLSRVGDRWAYDFKVRIKEIPDVAVGKGLVGWLLP